MNDQIQQLRGPFQLGVTTMPCWSCHNATPVGALATTEYTEVWAAREFDLEEAWWRVAGADNLSSVDKLSEDLAAEIAGHLPGLRIDHSKTADTTYFMNHCAHCDAKIGDFYVNMEPDSGLFGWPRYAPNPGVSIVIHGLKGGTVHTSDDQEPMDSRSQAQYKRDKLAHQARSR